MVFRSIVYVLETCFVLLYSRTVARGLLRNEGSEYAFKTIETEHGDIYDCVDFYKQPSFNHPLLKNHSFNPQMKPSSKPKRINEESNSLTTNEIPLDMIMLKDGGCPPGTVPIRRRDHIMQSKTFGSKMKSNERTHTISGTVYALGQTKSDSSKVYYGVGGTLSVYNPKAQPSQCSSAEIIIRGGSDEILAGWTVNPSIYKDNKTRFFIYSVANEKQCFDSDCGFILVRSDIPLNFVMHPISTVTGTIYTFPYFIYQDEKNGNWWLEVSSKHIQVGFWPQNIFQGLSKAASYAACGAEINSPPTLPAPDMGAGTYPDVDPDPKNFAYCKDFIVVDDAHNIVDPPDTERFVNGSSYNAVDTHMGKSHIVYFGGPDPFGKNV